MKLIVVTLIVVALLSIADASAHSWYPSECCGGDEIEGDCRAVPCSEISEQGDGSILWHGVTFSREQLRPSQDQSCHVCVNGNSGWPVPHCVFTPRAGA